MPKRKRARCDEDDYEYLEKQLRKLRRKIQSGRKRHRRDSSLSSGSDTSLHNPPECDLNAPVDDDVNIPEAGCSYWNDWPEPSEFSDTYEPVVDGDAGLGPPPPGQPPATDMPLPAVTATLPSPSCAAMPPPAVVAPPIHSNVVSTITVVPPPNATVSQLTATAPLSSTPAAAPAAAPPPSPAAALQNDSVELPMSTLDPDLLAILGEDPTVVKEYGDDIHNDLAIRLNHFATSGLSKEARKEIKEKYLIPNNCKMIKAPTLNAEIRASLIESQAKRDKGIENKQVLNSCALSSLGKAITLLLSSDHKNQEVLGLLMDTARILGDIQHSDSILRRFFVLSTVKKELKDQLEKTKIEDQLFGSNLAETLKSARTIHKSGADMRAPTATAKIGPNKTATFPNKSLNVRAPPTSRRPAQAGGARSARPTRPAPTPRQPTTTHRYHSSSSRTSSRQQYQRPRR